MPCPSLLLILGLATVLFGVLVPIFAMSAGLCNNPGCGGPRYESIGYLLFGYGETLSFASPNPPYGWIALGITVIFVAAIAYGLLHVSQRRPQEQLP